MQLGIDEFLELRKQLPIVDVRSEGEFEEGHIAGALNIPILNNAERKEVGTLYKQEGQQAAIRAGFRLVGPRLLDIITAAEHIGNELLVHCWRGGMRSGNFCQFVEMARIKSHQLTGGYKAYRTKVLDTYRLPLQLKVLGGCTGSGKSEILRALEANGEQIIDLELLANHKGSVFGGLDQPPQPTTEQFQNNLFETILKLDPSRTVWIEDESIAVGKIFLPLDLWHQMKQAPVIEVKVDRDIRVKRLTQEYGSTNPTEFIEAMTKITKKLGGQHFNAAHEKVLEGNMEAAIDILLVYYDKAYQNGLSKKQSRVVGEFTWNGTDISSFAAKLKSAPI